MNELDSGIIVIVFLVVIYYFWIKYELKAQLGDFVIEVQAKLDEAVLAVKSEPPGSKARAHLNEAQSMMREVEEFDWHSKTNMGDLIAVRQQLQFCKFEASSAIAYAQSKGKKPPGSAMIGVYV